MEPAERRRQILLAAEAVFYEKGYHAAAISDIIEAAGVARGTFYRYFDSKRAIFEAILDDFLELIGQQIHRIDVSDASPAPIDQLHEMLRGVLGTLYENPALTNVLLTQAVGLDPGFDEKLASFYDRLIARIDGALQIGRVIGLIRDCDTAIAARSIIGAAKELMADVARNNPQHDVESLIRGVTDIFIRGVAADSESFRVAGDRSGELDMTVSNPRADD
jgi:AcrR family transcriptional regulator